MRRSADLHIEERGTAWRIRFLTDRGQRWWDRRVQPGLEIGDRTTVGHPRGHALLADAREDGMWVVLGGRARSAA